MNRICLVVLIGLPAAGKTTFCQRFMQMQSLPFNILHLCYDNLIDFNSESITRYKEQRKRILNFLKETIIHFKNSSSLPKELQTMNIFYKNNNHNDTIILCDDNHFYRSMRYKLFQLAREQSLGFCQLFFNCEVQLALERNFVRDALQKIPNDVILQMNSRLEVPQALVSQWEKNTLNLQLSNLCKNNDEIIYFITQNMDKPVQTSYVSVSKSSTTQSKIHELDLLLRKRINILMSSEKNYKLAKNLNDKRKETLQLFQIDISCSLHEDVDINKYIDMLNCV